MNIIYKTPRQFCESISSVEGIPLKNYTRRPKFRFKPDECAWWLVPSTDNPHFKHGKFIFNWTDKNKISISTGLHIEKGLDEQIQTVYSSKKALKFIMDDSWYWNKFTNLINNNIFFQPLENLFDKYNNIQITIDGGYISEPTKFDPYQEKSLGWDKYIFDWSHGSEKLTLTESKRDAFVLKLHHIKSITDLKISLNELSKDMWLWLNIYVTVNFQISTRDAASDIEIWNYYFKHLNALI